MKHLQTCCITGGGGLIDFADEEVKAGQGDGSGRAGESSDDAGPGAHFVNTTLSSGVSTEAGAAAKFDDDVPFDCSLVSSSNEALRTAATQIESSRIADSPGAAMSFAEILLRLTGSPLCE